MYGPPSQTESRPDGSSTWFYCTDLLGLGDFIPRHARPYASLRGVIRDAAAAYAGDVVADTFPGPGQGSSMDDGILDAVLGRGRDDRATDAPVPEGLPLDRDL